MIMMMIMMGNIPFGASQVVHCKESACQFRRWKRHGFNPWVKRIPGGGNGNWLPYSWLRNPMDREAQQATVHGVTESGMTKRLSRHIHMPFVKQQESSRRKQDIHPASGCSSSLLIRDRPRVRRNVTVSPGATDPGWETWWRLSSPEPENSATGETWQQHLLPFRIARISYPRNGDAPDGSWRRNFWATARNDKAGFQSRKRSHVFFWKSQ